MRKGDSCIREPDQRRLRALMMLEYRVKNAASYHDLAKEFGVSVDTAKRTLSWARKAGLVVDAEDRILQDLVPLAHNAIKTALEAGDAKIALEIFKGILPSFNGKAQKPTTSTTTTGDDLNAYINELRGSPGVVEGETVPQRTLPAAAEAAPPAGVSAAD